MKCIAAFVIAFVVLGYMLGAWPFTPAPDRLAEEIKKSLTELGATDIRVEVAK